MNLAPYWKTIIAFIGAAIVILQPIVADDLLSSNELFAAIAALVTAAGVYLKRNAPEPPAQPPADSL